MEFCLCKKGLLRTDTRILYKIGQLGWSIAVIPAIDECFVILTEVATIDEWSRRYIGFASLVISSPQTISITSLVLTDIRNAHRQLHTTSFLAKMHPCDVLVEKQYCKSPSEPTQTHFPQFRHTKKNRLFAPHTLHGTHSKQFSPEHWCYA